MTDPSPICATQDIVALYNTPTVSSIYPSPCPQTGDDRRSDTDSDTATPTPSTQLPRTYSVPRFEDYSYSPRTPFKPTTSCRLHLSPDYLSPDPDHAIQNHKKRLSRTLSSQHALAEELVPSPLFSRGPLSNKESQSQSHSSTQSLPIIPLPLPQVALCRPLPPTPNNRPLPNLPFNHKPQFIRKGKRFIVVPRRKTALSTLISRWEGKVPFGDLSPPLSGTVDQEMRKADCVGIETTPVTERFRKISAIFAEKEEDSNTCNKNTQQELKDCVRVTAEESDGGFDDNDDNTSDTNSDIDTDKENADPYVTHKYDSKPPAPISPTKSLIPRLSKPTSYPHTPKTPCPTQNYSFSTPKSIHNPTLPPTSTPHKPPPPLKTPHPPFQPVQPPYFSHPPPTNINTTTNTYTITLLSLQKSLQTHTTTITTTILQTRAIQETHDQEKRSRFFNNYRRAPSISPSPSPSPPSSPTKTNNKNDNNRSSRNTTKHRASRITPAKDARLRSFWSLQDADALSLTARRARAKNSSVGVKEGLDDEVARKKKERIARLKERGWDVRKEKVGFKGVEYYELLAAGVEGEMEGR